MAKKEKTKKDKQEEKIKCSFCGKKHDLEGKGKKIVAGPGVNICEECVDLCGEIVEEFREEDREEERMEQINRDLVNDMREDLDRRVMAMDDGMAYVTARLKPQFDDMVNVTLDADMVEEIIITETKTTTFRLRK